MGRRMGKGEGRKLGEGGIKTIEQVKKKNLINPRRVMPRTKFRPHNHSATKGTRVRITDVRKVQRPKSRDYITAEKRNEMSLSIGWTAFDNAPPLSSHSPLLRL